MGTRSYVCGRSAKKICHCGLHRAGRRQGEKVARTTGGHGAWTQPQRISRRCPPLAKRSAHRPAEMENLLGKGKRGIVNGTLFSQTRRGRLAELEKTGR